MDVPLDPELRQELVTRAKQQLRVRMKALRGGYPRGALAKRSALIVERLLETNEIQEAKSVASFWPMDARSEVDLRGLDTILRARGVSLFYPFMDPKPQGGHVTGFRASVKPEELLERGQRFAEPPAGAPVAGQGDIDVVLVPALSVDTRGHRLGYGAGYYDATLGDVCPPARSIVVAFHFQLMAELPTEPHDRACDAVVTDERYFRSAL
jgi:5-formyltetrahydrofolate cyclo-ligase